MKKYVIQYNASMTATDKEMAEVQQQVEAFLNDPATAVTSLAPGISLLVLDVDLPGPQFVTKAVDRPVQFKPRP